jgi:hypothetical protein
MGKYNGQSYTEMFFYLRALGAMRPLGTLWRLGREPLLAMSEMNSNEK